MARPKEQTTTAYQSAAFLDKCLKEKDRLKTKISQQLRDDVLRMLGEELHTDLTVTNGKKNIQAHKSLFLTRVGSIFPELQNKDETKITLNNLNNVDLETLVREVYYVEDVNYMCAYSQPKLDSKVISNGEVSPLTENEITSQEDDIHRELEQLTVNESDRTEEHLIISTEIQQAPETSENGLTDGRNNNPIETREIKEVDKNEDSLDTRNTNEESRPDKDSGGGTGVPQQGDPRQEELSEMIKLSYSLSLPHETCSKLGGDLLRMFLQEIACDTTLVVDGQQFHAHKCILSARSSYFEAMFGGLWSESGADKVVLEGVTPCALEQALLYLYGGVIEVIEPCEMTELLHVADMYGLEGLKDIVCFHIRKDSCHFYHKPCPTCEVTAAGALTIAATYRLDDIRERTLKWINKNFTKLVATKQFACMPDNVLNICYDSLVEQLTDQTVIDTILECHKLTSKMPRVKWAEPVLDLTAKLMDAAIEFTSQHFVAVVQSQRFLMSGKSAAWSVSVLDDIFSNVIDALPPSKACEAYRTLLTLHSYSVAREEGEGSPWGEDMQSLLETLIDYTEMYMKHYIHQVTLSPAWREMPAEIRKKILTSASYVCIDQDLTNMIKPPQLSNKKQMNKADLRPRNRPRPHTAPRSSTGVKDSTKRTKSDAPQTTPVKRPGSRGLGDQAGSRSPRVKASEMSRSPKVKSDVLRSPRVQAGEGSRSPRVKPAEGSSSPRVRPGEGSRTGQRLMRSPPKQVATGRPSSASASSTSSTSQSPKPGGSKVTNGNGNVSRVGNSRLENGRSGTPTKQSMPARSLTPSKLRQPSPRSRFSPDIRGSPSPVNGASSRRILGNSLTSRVSLSPTPRTNARSQLPIAGQSSLRAARSTGSLNQSRDLRATHRSASTVDLDLDAWGLKRQPFSTTNLDRLVPILEMVFTAPIDTDESEETSTESVKSETSEVTLPTDESVYSEATSPADEPESDQ